MTIVIDYDGTLTNESIGDLVDELGLGSSDYKKMNELIEKFTPKKGVGIIEAASISPMIVTGRQESLRKASENWLREHQIPFEDMIMVPDGYYGGAFDWNLYVQFKISAIKGQSPRFVLDDSKSLVTILNNHNIPAFHVGEDFEQAFIEAWEMTE